MKQRVFICPDKFKGTLTATEAAQAIADGWRQARPEDQLDLLPVSDGGDGQRRSFGLHSREVVASWISVNPNAQRTSARQPAAIATPRMEVLVRFFSRLLENVERQSNASSLVLVNAGEDA